jgi:hypothetical protein
MLTITSNTIGGDIKNHGSVITQLSAPNAELFGVTSKAEFFRN